MKNYILFLILFVLSGSLLNAQESDRQNAEKKILDHSVYNDWKRLENVKISNDGKFTSFEINKQKGDGVLNLKNLSNDEELLIPRGYDNTFSSNSDFAAFKIKVPEDSLRKLKLAKKKKETFPKDSFAVVLLNDIKKPGFKYSGLISFKLPVENSQLVAFMRAPEGSKKDTVSKSDIDVYELNVLNPVTGTNKTFNDVYEFNFSKNGDALVYLSLIKGKVDTTKVFVFKKDADKPELLFSKKGYGKDITVDSKGGQVAFIHSPDTAKVKRYGLYYGDMKSVGMIADNNSAFLNTEWEVSPYTDLMFSDDGSKLYFHTAPKLQPEPKDSLLDEEKYKVDVWNYQDPYLQTQQLHDLDKTKKQKFLAVYDRDLNNFYQIEDLKFETVKYPKNGNTDYYLGIDENPYKRSQSWIQPEQKDLYSINYKNGRKVLVAESVQYNDAISPTGKYITWFDNADSSFYIYNNQTGTKSQLTNNLSVRYYDELNDVPNIPNPYGFAGWTTNDEYVLVYDRFDVWKFPAVSGSEPVKLTAGRENNTVYRIQKINYDSTNIGLDEPLLIKGINETNWQEEFWSATVNKGMQNKLISLDNKFVSLFKAKKSDKLVFQKSSYIEFPDLWKSDMSFSNITKISDANPQQKDYNWGTVEQVYWKDSAGAEQRGLLLKPENFDANKKYPMITYFYDISSNRFHGHTIPNPSRSVVNFPLYNSNGYIIFIPDISYKVGYPGKSAYNAIVSGAKYLADTYSFIDRDNIGLQGQSWGGYQVAYLVTQTDFFKAAMSGAPVSNMTSAYGGIRWESGVNRIFQYEKEQSRIGGTLWEKFDLFVENSPLFFADKVNTPLMIMANDGDGAVPWQQGIEFFVSLRRLGKTVYMVSYNGDEHNLVKWPNRVDLSIRMKQFFDHYLKGEPMPEWMKDGIPAVKKGLINGY